MGTRAIVFTNVRSSVDEILNHLKQLAPMCRVGPTVSSVVDHVVALAALYLVCGSYGLRTSKSLRADWPQ